MKRFAWLALVMALLCAAFPVALAQEDTYQLGDTMDDFAVTLSDGTETFLYGLLTQKKAVLINFWASWCGPCKIEFPFMQQAYDELSDDVGIIALSIEPKDTKFLAVLKGHEQRVLFETALFTGMRSGNCSVSRGIAWTSRTGRSTSASSSARRG